MMRQKVSSVEKTEKLSILAFPSNTKRKNALSFVFQDAPPDSENYERTVYGNFQPLTQPWEQLAKPYLVWAFDLVSKTFSVSN